MQFSKIFYRWKGGAQPATGQPGGPIAADNNSAQTLGADTVPAVNTNAMPNLRAMSNLVTTRFTSVNGWPGYRIAVLYKAPSGTLALNADLYMYEKNLDMWFRLNQTTGAGNLTPGVVAFFDCMSLMDFPHAQADLQGVGEGSFEGLLVVGDPGAAPAGLHSFAMAPELTSRGDL